MLKQRVLTAAILAPLAIFGVLLLPTFWMSAVLTLLFWISCVEWSGLIEWDSRLKKKLFYVIFIACLIVAAILSTTENSTLKWVWLLSVVWWCSAFVWVARYPGIEQAGHYHWLLKAAVGLVILLPAWLAAVCLHAIDPRWMLYALMIVWVADIGAYFSGKRFGRHKIAPRVSPGKTWEGAVGGLIFVAVLAAVAGQVFDFQDMAIAKFMGLTIIVAVFSIVGDLIISLFKRDVGKKDSGNLLPGHGGLLDRLDSWMAVLPLLWVGLVQLELVVA